MVSRPAIPSVPSELVNFRVGWVPLSRSIELASARLRCLLPLGALQRAGLATELYDRERDHYDGFIFQKAYEESHLAMAEQWHDAGKPILLDLCDHHFHVPSGDKNLLARAARLRRMLKFATIVSVSTPELARALDLERFFLIEDFPDFPPPRSFADAWKNWSRLGRRKVIRSPLRLVWFGNAGSHIEGFGLPDLERIVPEINRAARHVRLDLAVISNNEKLARKVLRAAEFPFRYHEWSYLTFHHQFRRHDVCLIPITRNPFTSCKTSNRLTLALSAGLPVICDFIPSYEPFRPFVLEENWEQSIALCAAKYAQVQSRALAGRAWLLKTCTEARVTNQWLAAITALRGSAAAVTPALSTDRC